MSMTLEPPQTEIRHPDLAEHLRAFALNLDGPFLLSSGKTSHFYLDAKRSGLDPEGIRLAVHAIAAETRGLEFDAIGGLELGAAPIIGAFVYWSGAEGSRPVSGFIVRKAEKSHGTRKKIEGPLPKRPLKIVIIDDVVTSGQSIMQAVDAVRELDHEVVLAISVVDRESGAQELLDRNQVPYRPLVRASELGIAEDGNPGRS